LVSYGHTVVYLFNIDNQQSITVGPASLRHAACMRSLACVSSLACRGWVSLHVFSC
jgi:hypothetical protein